MAGFLIVMLNLAVFSCVAIFLLNQIWTLVRYIMDGISVYRIAVRRKIENPWLVWVPLMRSWVLGAVSDDYRQKTANRQTNRRRYMLLLKIINSIVGTVGLSLILGAFVLPSADLAGDVAAVLLVLGLLCMCGWRYVRTGYGVYTYFPTYDLYKSACPEKTVKRLVLSIIFPCLIPFFICACSKSDEGMPATTEE